MKDGALKIENSDRRPTVVRSFKNVQIRTSPEDTKRWPGLCIEWGSAGVPGAWPLTRRVEFLSSGDLEAAAERVRRGGGDAPVVCPSGRPLPASDHALCAPTPPG